MIPAKSQRELSGKCSIDYDSGYMGVYSLSTVTPKRGTIYCMSIIALLVKLTFYNVCEYMHVLGCNIKYISYQWDEIQKV